jgi:deoxyribodipyrimidine photo-lyase
MRELYFTGYMSNRGRQNVASFLAKDLNIDWRIGASWFESLLIDYDVYSNWGNWNYNAGVGGDPRKDRFFNIILQAKKYDPKAEFIKLWVPELAHLDAYIIHDWHALARSEQKKLAPDYYAPLIVNERWMNF